MNRKRQDLIHLKEIFLTNLFSLLSSFSSSSFSFLSSILLVQ